MKINLFRNIPLKLASLLIAFILWLLLTSGENLMVDFHIPLQIRGLATDLSIAGDFVDSIDVRVRAADTIVQQLTASQIDATINLSELQEGEHIMPITSDKIRVPFGVEVVKINPSRIKLIIQKKIEKNVPIMPLLIGRVTEGFEQTDVKIEPSLAKISGPEEEVVSMEKASTDAIFLANRNKSFTASAKVIVDNPNISIIEPSTVLVEVNIAEIEQERIFKEVPIVDQNTIFNVRLNPGKVKVVLKGGKLLIDSLEKENIKVLVNLAELNPRTAWYNIKPSIEFEPSDLADRISIVSISPEVIKVRIYATRKK